MSASLSRSDRIRVYIMVGIATMSLAARLLAQQDARSLAVGAHVRISVESRPRPLQGVVLQSSPGLLTLAVPGAVRPDTISLRQDAITAIQVRRTVGNRAGTGAGIGALAGFAFGLVTVAGSGCSAGQFCFEPSPGAVLAGSVVGSAALGALIGLAIPRHRWEDVPVSTSTPPLALIPAPDGNGAGIRIALPAIR